MPDARLVPACAAQELAARIRQALSDRQGEQRTADTLAGSFRDRLSAADMSRKIASFYKALQR
jgi:hypothetical protein